MNLVYQPPGSNLCGPAAVATIAGVTLEDAIVTCEKRGLTRASHLRAGLSTFGWVDPPYSDWGGRIVSVYPVYMSKRKE